MPRDPTTKQYAYPVGTPGVPNTTILSDKYNTYIDDIALDLNDARPVVTGGTGATDAAAARTNLQAERAMQTVTNYDSHVWENGSFWSAAGATGAPEASGTYGGICCIINNDPDYIIIEATEASLGGVYVRRKYEGVWGAWTAATEGLATIDYVNSVVVNTSLQALAYNGLQINGDMTVVQEKPTTSGTYISDPSQYIVDGWKARLIGAVDVTWTHGLNTSYFPGFSSNLASIVNIAKPSLAAGDIVGIYQHIEGYRISRLAWGTANASPITIGFWVLHNRAGTYTGSITNQTSTRSYVFSYTQNVAATLEYKTVVIPGCQDGVWEKGNQIGMTINFTQACGTTFTAPSLNSWVTGNYVAGPGQINGIGLDASNFRITGVVILPEIQALTAATSPLLMRPLDYELAICQRYYQKSYPQGINPNTNAVLSNVHVGLVAANSIPDGVVVGMVSFATVMRQTPVVTIYGYSSGGTGKISDNLGNNLAANSGSVAGNGDRSFGVKNMSGGVIVTASNTIMFHWVADARL